MDPNDRFGVNLRHARLEQELSQEELAGLAGLHPRTISRYERGLRMVSLPTLIRLATVLRVEPKTLYEGIHYDPAKRRFYCDPAGPRPGRD